MQYRVRWEIDLEAPTPVEAARMALEIQRDPDSIATVFEVYPNQNIPPHLFFTVDLRRK